MVALFPLWCTKYRNYLWYLLISNYGNPKSVVKITIFMEFFQVKNLTINQEL